MSVTYPLPTPWLFEASLFLYSHAHSVSIILLKTCFFLESLSCSVLIQFGLSICWSVVCSFGISVLCSLVLGTLFSRSYAYFNFSLLTCWAGQIFKKHIGESGFFGLSCEGSLEAILNFFPTRKKNLNKLKSALLFRYFRELSEVIGQTTLSRVEETEIDTANVLSVDNVPYIQLHKSLFFRARDTAQLFSGIWWISEKSKFILIFLFLEVPCFISF